LAATRSPIIKHRELDLRDGAGQRAREPFVGPAVTRSILSNYPARLSPSRRSDPRSRGGASCRCGGAFAAKRGETKRSSHIQIRIRLRGSLRDSVGPRALQRGDLIDGATPMRRV